MRRLAATALAASLPLYTRNPNDFEGLDDLMRSIARSADVGTYEEIARLEQSQGS